MIKSRLAERLGIKYPIFQGGMAWVADASLASAVSNAGGLGIIGAGNMPADCVRTEIHKARALTEAPFGVNVMLMSPHADAVMDMLYEERVAVVTTGAGNPGKYLERLKGVGTVVIPVIPSVGLARRVVQAGADAVIAEGSESGGHIGEMTTMALVPQVVDAVEVPVVAAGGIGDGRGLAAAFCLGADAVQLGTRFIVAQECTVHPNYKRRIIDAKDIDTVVAGRCTGHPVRAIRNRFVRRFLDMERSGAAIHELDEFGAGRLALVVREGDVDMGSVMAGQIAGLIRREQTARDIVESLMSEATATIWALAGAKPQRSE